MRGDTTRSSKIPRGKVGIYVLREGSKYRYVGASVNPWRRWKWYWNQHVNHKWSSPPVVEILEICSEKDWPDRERHYISKFRSQGFDLLNKADGGPGSPGFFYEMPVERKRKISESKKGWCPPASTLKKAHQGVRRKIKTDGPPVSWYDRSLLFEGAKKRKSRGPWHSSRTKEKISLSMKQWHQENPRRQWTQKSRRKLAIAIQKSWTERKKKYGGSGFRAT